MSLLQNTPLRKAGLRRAALLLALLLAPAAAGCAGEPETLEEARPDTEETTEEVRDLHVEEVTAGQQGLDGPQILLSPSAEALSDETRMEIPDSGAGVYVGAFWGEQRTGGYVVRIESAEQRADEVTVRVSLQRPGPGDIVTQALTYPFAVAVVRDVEADETRFTFVSENGGELDWPVRTVATET
jgi:hypothetical protein